MGRVEKPINTKHREGDYMCYTYYHESKLKNGSIVYHKNCCRKRIKPENEKKKRGPKVCDAVSRYKKLKKEKEMAIRELKKKLILKVDSFSLSDLRGIVKIVDDSPCIFAERLINADNTDNADSIDNTDRANNSSGNDTNAEPITTGEALEVLRSML